MVPNPRGVRRKTPEKKRTKKRESLVVKRRLFPSFFHFVNLREIHRESLPNNFNPIVEYLRLKQDSLYLETQKAYYGLSEKDIDNFYATRYPKFRERMRELQQLIDRVKKFHKHKEKLKERGLEKKELMLRLNRIFPLLELEELTSEAVNERPKLVREVRKLETESHSWRQRK